MSLYYSDFAAEINTILLVTNYYPDALLTGSFAVYLLTQDKDVLSSNYDLDFVIPRRDKVDSSFLPKEIENFEVIPNNRLVTSCKYISESLEFVSFDLSKEYYRFFKKPSSINVLDEEGIIINEIEIINPKNLLSLYSHYTDEFLMDPKKYSSSLLKIEALKKLDLEDEEISTSRGKALSFDD